MGGEVSLGRIFNKDIEDEEDSENLEKYLESRETRHLDITVPNFMISTD